MAILLTGLGLFIYLRFESQLDGTIDQGLRSRADDVAALVSRSGPSLRQQGSDLLSEREESFAQILGPSGTIVDSSPQLPAQPLLSPAELRRAERSPILVERTRITGIEEPARLLASPIAAQGRELVVVVGPAPAARADALASLGRLLLIGGPAALLLASLAGYGTAVLALRPVEAMRRRASEISADEPGERLPQPVADDELRRLGETLNAMLARLEAALERERAFVDDASHELRTPLALHKAELELGLRYAETTEDLRAAIASAIEEVDRLVQLAEDLLVVARSEKGRLALSLERVPVTGLFETVRERFSIRAAEAGRPLIVEPADGVVIDVDRLRVEQALTNLVDNALRYGDGEIRLWAGRASEGVIELHVSDRGPGFPPEFLPRAFERFARADAGRARGGTGLGLAIVDAIAGAHRGTARAVNLDPGADVAIAVGDSAAADGGDDGDD